MQLDAIRRDARLPADPYFESGTQSPHVTGT